MLSLLHIVNLKRVSNVWLTVQLRLSEVACTLKYCSGASDASKVLTVNYSTAGFELKVISAPGSAEPSRRTAVYVKGRLLPFKGEGSRITGETVNVFGP